MANEIDETTRRWYGGEKSDAPKSDANDWRYVPHPNPKFAGHWEKTAPVTFDGFVWQRRSKP